jgi:hypothetical protein
MPMKRAMLIILALFGLVQVAGAAPVTVDLREQFPDNQGENGFYAEAYNTVALTYRPLTRSGSYYFDTPTNLPYLIPKVFKDPSIWIQMRPSGQNALTPPGQPEDAVLRWTVPESNTYSISVEFEGISAGNFKVYVKTNDTTLDEHEITGVQTWNYSHTNIPLQKNDRIIFGVSAEGFDLDDIAHVRGQITYNPIKRMSLNLWDKFPDQQGQNGLYAYAYDYGGADYRLLTRISAYYFGTPEQDYNIPYVSRSNSPWITMHPSQNPASATVFPPENAVLAWRPPQNNTYDLTGEFAQHETYGGGEVTVYVWENASLLWSHTLTLSEPSATFTLTNVTLSSTDRIYFGVNAGGDDYNDTTKFQGQIAYNPRDTQIPGNFLLLE